MLPRLRVVFLVARLPEPIRGGLDLRVRALVEALASHHDVTVIGFAGDPLVQSIQNVNWVTLDGARPIDQARIASDVLTDPLEPFRSFLTDEINNQLRNRLDLLGPQIVIVSRSQLWVYAEAMREVCSAKFILDLDECAIGLVESFEALDYQGIARSVQRRFLGAVAAYESSILDQPDEIWVSTQVEHARLTALGCRTSVRVIANCVRMPTEPAPEPNADPPRVIFPGNFAYQPNVEAAQEVIDAIAPRLPELKFQVLGSHVQRLNGYERPPNVELIGPIEDMGQFYAGATATVVPLRAGGGSRLKILESMAWGVPVIGTRKAYEGLEVEYGVHALLVDETPEFATTVRALMVDCKTRRELVNRAKEFVEIRHSITALNASVMESIQALRSSTSRLRMSGYGTSMGT